MSTIPHQPGNSAGIVLDTHMSMQVAAVRKLYVELEQRRARGYPKKELVAARKTLGGVLGVRDDRQV